MKKIKQGRGDLMLRYFSFFGATANLLAVFSRFLRHCWTSQQWHLVLFTRLRVGLVLVCLMVVAFGDSVMAQDRNAEGNAEIIQQLVQIREQMNLAADALNDSPVDGRQLVRQKKIADELALLVGQFSASGQSNSPPPQSTTSSSESPQTGRTQGGGQTTVDTPSEADNPVVEQPDLTERQLVLRSWGEMPGQLNEQQGSGISPKFLPKYEFLIRVYYQRMSK